MGNRQITGVLAALERFLVEADERGNAFLVSLLEKEQRRLKTLFDRHIVSTFIFDLSCQN